MEYKIEELLVLVKELVDMYTSKESTSVTYEVAQQLMGAVLYCIEENAINSSEDGLDNTKVSSGSNQTAREAYDLGYQLVTDKIKKANHIYIDIIEDFKDYGNLAYYDTVAKGMPEFFKWYHPRLDPQNHILTLDYRVLENLQELHGIDLIYRYLKCIQLEQTFLKRLPEEYIREILMKHHSQYDELLINIAGIVIRKILVNMLIDTNLDKIYLETNDYKKLIEIVNQSGRELLPANLLHQLETLIRKFYNEDQALLHYLKNEIPDLTADLMYAVNNNVVENFI